jgi:hypothetical protein
MSNLSDYKLTISTNDDLSLTGSITANNITVSTDLSVQGDLSVTGTQTINNTTTLTVNDNKITLNSGQSGTPSLNASVVIDRGSSADTELRWNESTDKWEQTRDGSTYVTIPINTTELSEGTNQYFTNARARTAISVTGSGSYDNTTGVITVTGGVTSVNSLSGAVTLSTTNISEGTNLYYTDTRANTAFDARLATKSTTDLTEGTNLYYTNARANSAMAAFTGNLTAGNASLGNLVTANYFAGTLTTAAQPNITSTGTLTSLNVTGTITGGNLTSNAEIAGYGALTLGNIANATATKTRIVTAGTISYIQTGNGTAGSTGNVVFSPTLDSTARVSIDTSSGNLNATGNITGANLIAGTSGTGNVYAGNVIATSVIVNGQPTTYGVVSPNYINMTTSTAVNLAASGTDLTWDVNNGSSGITYSAGKFSLTAGKTYHILAEIAMQQFSANGYLLVELVDGTTNARIGSQTLSIPYNTGFNEANNPTLDIVHTPVANQDVKLRVTGGTVGLTAQLRGGGFTRMSIVQINPTIAVQATATGTVAKNYAKYTRTASQSVSANSVIICNVLENTSGTAVSVNTSTGQATLTAGTYRLRGTAGTTVSSNSSSFIGYGWYNETTSAWIGEGAQIISPSSTNFNVSTGGTAEAVITVASTAVVSLRVISATNIDSIGGNQSDFAGTYANPWIDIEQIGATFALNALDTMTTTGNVSVGGNLTVTGGVRKSNRILTTTATLTLADAGGFIQFNGGPYTVTLPNPTLAANAGIGYRFWQNTASNITLSTPAGSFFGPSGTTTSTVVLVQATTSYWDVWSDGFNWAVFGIKIA